MPSVARLPSAMKTSSSSAIASSSKIKQEPVVARTSSLAGKKRSRESDHVYDGATVPAPRRTKSTGDAITNALLLPNGGKGKNKTAAGKGDDGHRRAMIRTFVRNALEQVAQGNDEPYQELLSHFLPTPLLPVPDFPALHPLLTALTSCASLLTAFHSSLVKAILALPWATADEKFVRVYMGFVGVLVTSNAGWVGEALGRLVKGFQWQSTHETNPSSTPITRRTLYARHHALLLHLLQLIPTLPTTLLPILLRSFPWPRESYLSFSAYWRNMLQVGGYCAEVQGGVWECGLGRMIGFDVAIQTELEELDEDTADFTSLLTESSSDPFDTLITTEVLDPLAALAPPDEDQEIAIEDLSSDEEDSDDSFDAEDDKKRKERRRRVESDRRKLDEMTSIFLRHLQSTLSPLPASSSLSFSSSPTTSPTQHFASLLTLFDTLLLPTPRTRRCQFILFYACSLNPAFVDLFLGLLVSRSLFEGLAGGGPNVASQGGIGKRIAAVGYLGSFVCRASYLDESKIREVVKFLLAYIDGEMSNGMTGPTEEGGAVVYAVVQAVMLIFCFRWAALRDGNGRGSQAVDEMEDLEMEMDFEGLENLDKRAGKREEGAGGGKWMKDLDVLQRVVLSPLNPLLACYPAVVDMFAKIADATGFMFCYSRIQANASLTSTTSAASSTPAFSTHSRSSSGSEIERRREEETRLPLAAREELRRTGLESWFPFDPLDLPRTSEEFIDTPEGSVGGCGYREWGDVELPEGMKGAVETEDEDEDETETETENETGTEMESATDPSTSVSAGMLSMSGGAGESWRLRGFHGGRGGGDGRGVGGLGGSLEGMSISIST